MELKRTSKLLKQHVVNPIFGNHKIIEVVRQCDGFVDVEITMWGGYEKDDDVRR